MRLVASAACFARLRVVARRLGRVLLFTVLLFLRRVALHPSAYLSGRSEFLVFLLTASWLLRAIPCFFNLHFKCKSSQLRGVIRVLSRNIAAASLSFKPSLTLSIGRVRCRTAVKRIQRFLLLNSELVLLHQTTLRA